MLEFEQCGMNRHFRAEYRAPFDSTALEEIGLRAELATHVCLTDDRNNVMKGGDQTDET
jgi:hypothetical protein